MELVADATRLHPDDVEAIAVRVAALLQKPPSPPPVRLVDAATLAAILDVERDWVYAHARELRAVRRGGKRGRLRFDLASVFRSLNAEDSTLTSPLPHPSVAKAVQLGGELLPIDP
jgi:hypothetical protein